MPIHRIDKFREVQLSTALAARIGVCLLICRGAFAGLTPAEVSQRNQEVRQMSSIERARLQRNWQTFQQLPGAQQEHYRRLHLELEQDRGELKQLVTTYSQWLQTLNPGQRENLRKTKDPFQKLALVRKYKEEQDEQLEGHSLNEEVFTPGQDRRLSLMLKRLSHDRTPLSQADLRVAMEALAASLPPEGQARLQGQEKKWLRYREILEASGREAGGPKNWPSRNQQDLMRQALKDSNQLRNLDKVTDDNLRRNIVGRMLYAGLIAEMLEDSKLYRPKESELQQILQHLENDERDELMQLPEMRWKEELSDKYYRKRTDQVFQEFMSTRQEFLRALYRFDRDARLLMGFGRPAGGPGQPGWGSGPREPPRNRIDKSGHVPGNDK